MYNSELLNSFEPENFDMKDINMIEDVEECLLAESDKILKAKETKTQQKNQMNDMRSTAYYCNIVFANRGDKNKFLSHLIDVEVEGECFIDGYELAKYFGIDIPMTATLPEPKFIKQFKIKENKKI